MDNYLLVLNNPISINQPAIHALFEILPQVQVINISDEIPLSSSYKNIICCSSITNSSLIWNWLDYHRTLFINCRVVSLVDIFEGEETWLLDERIWQIECKGRVISDRFSVNDTYAAKDLAFAILGSDPFSSIQTTQIHSGM